MIAHIVGIDPGLVHTGVVRLIFDSKNHTLTIESTVLDGLDAEGANDWTFQTGLPRPEVFIEKYQPRQVLSTDVRMVQGEKEFKHWLPSAKVLSNTGVKRVAAEPLMRALGVWKFNSVTHHQDLRSAARIAVLGMMKDDNLNQVLADFIRAHLNHKPWQIQDI